MDSEEIQESTTSSYFNARSLQFANEVVHEHRRIKNHLTSHIKLLHMTEVQEASRAKLYFPTKVPNYGMSVSVYFAAIITGVTNVVSIQTSSQERTS